MNVVPDNARPNNLPLVQVRQGSVSKCALEKPNGYIPPDKRVAAVHQLETMRAAYSLLMRGEFKDFRSDVDRLSSVQDDSSIPQNIREDMHIAEAQRKLLLEYNSLAKRLMDSYSFDICQETKRQGITVAPHKVLKSLSKTKITTNGLTKKGSIGEHLIDKSHRFFGLPEQSVIQLALKEAKRNTRLTESEIGKAFENLKRAERDLAKSMCPKPENTKSPKSSVAKDTAEACDLSWYHNPWIVATLSIGATIGVHHLVKRSRG